MIRRWPLLLLLAMGVGAMAQDQPPPGQLPAAPSAQAPAAPPAATQGPASLRLTLPDAEALALKNNPQITVARLNALASREVVRETRSALMPNAFVSLTGVDAEENSRIAAGGLNNPVIFRRAAAGTTVSQLVTDFGRTTNLVAGSRLRAEAADQDAIATSEQVRLAVDQAFYASLETSALVKVAEQTVKTRQDVVDRIQALTTAKLKSDLDLSFASVDLAQAKLLLLEAQNNYNASLASLSAILGYAGLQDFELVEETSPLAAPPADIASLIGEASARRPELAALRYDSEAAQKFRNAEHDLARPTVSALGAVGSVPLGDPQLAPWYGAVGFNVNLPVFNGFLFSARAREADLRAQAAQQQVRDLSNRISRDVRTAWLNANKAYERLAVTRQMQQEATLALDLAQSRYDLGLGSIVEFSQAELQKTEADISNVSAQYQYRYSLSALRYQTGGR